MIMAQKMVLPLERAEQFLRAEERNLPKKYLEIFTTKSELKEREMSSIHTKCFSSGNGKFSQQ